MPIFVGVLMVVDGEGGVTDGRIAACEVLDGRVYTFDVWMGWVLLGVEIVSMVEIDVGIDFVIDWLVLVDIHVDVSMAEAELDIEDGVIGLKNEEVDGVGMVKVDDEEYREDASIVAVLDGDEVKEETDNDKEDNDFRGGICESSGLADMAVVEGENKEDGVESELDVVIDVDGSRLKPTDGGHGPPVSL